MTMIISPELYEKFKDEILRYTNARQRYEPGKPQRGLSDAEIAEKLGISIPEVTEIRCIAELDVIDTSRFLDADGWKQECFEMTKVGIPAKTPSQ
jgi:hypothetical protein